MRSQLEYAVQVWAPYYAEQADRIERIHRFFARYALRRIPWVQQQGVSTYEDRCQRLKLQRMCTFELLSANIECPPLREKLPYMFRPVLFAIRLRSSRFLRIVRTTATIARVLFAVVYLMMLLMSLCLVCLRISLEIR